MDINITVGIDGMVTYSPHDISLRQGNHKTDRIIADVTSVSEARIYFEFDLPYERKHVTEVFGMSGESITYEVPSEVLLYAGRGYLQVVMDFGEKITRSNMISFMVEESVCAENSLSESERNGIFFKMDEAISNIRTATGEAESVTDDLKVELDRAGGLIEDIENRLLSGEFVGEKGDNGITPVIGNNGNWFIGDSDTGKTSRGPKGDKGDKGDKGERGMMSEIKGFFQLYVNNEGNLIARYPDGYGNNNLHINTNGELILTI